MIYTVLDSNKEVLTNITRHSNKDMFNLFPPQEVAQIIGELVDCEAIGVDLIYEELSRSITVYADIQYEDRTENKVFYLTQTVKPNYN